MNTDRPLREGFTTGTAASGAAKAATWLLLTGQGLEQVDTPLPGGGRLSLALAGCGLSGEAAFASVVKDGGDDPDVTHGAVIVCRVARLPGQSGEVRIEGGRGVGRVTLPGLPVPVGASAINPGPLTQIRAAVTEAATAAGYDGALSVVVEVPEGERLAGRTLNPRLGIVGGISILGVSGIVRPFSHAAWEASIAEALDVAKALGHDTVGFSSGRRSEALLAKSLPQLPETARIQAADCFAFALEQAAKRRFPRIVWATFGGKLVKMAQGLANTHAHRGETDFSALAGWCRTAGWPEERALAAGSANTARHVFELAPDRPALLALARVLGGQALAVMAAFAGPIPALALLVFDFDGAPPRPPGATGPGLNGTPPLAAPRLLCCDAATRRGAPARRGLFPAAGLDIALSYVKGRTGMRKMLCILVLTGLLVACGQTLHAEIVVGRTVSQTEAFKNHVAQGKAMEATLRDLDTRIASKERALDGIQHTFWFQIASLCVWLRHVIYPAIVLCLVSMILYLRYLVKYNPRKWRLMTSSRTFTLLRSKILRQNGLLGLLLLASLGCPGAVSAKTNVLQDIMMYYTGNQFEQGYLRCKYAKAPVKLGYADVAGVPVIEQPRTPFERDYDLLAHLAGLARPLGAEELLALYAKARNNEECRLVFQLLARTDRELAREAGLAVIQAMVRDRGLEGSASIDRFALLLEAVAAGDNRLLSGTLVTAYLEGAAGRVKRLEDLDNLVDLALANNAFEVLREPTAKLLQGIPNRLSFAETVYAARLFLRIDKDRARSLFNAIRYDLREFTRADVLSRKLAGLIRELAGVAAFQPLYDADPLYRALQQQQNGNRVAVAALFDQADPALAAIAYDAISLDYRELVFRDPRTLADLAALTRKYGKDKAPELLASLARTAVELDVPYDRDVLAKAAEALGQTPAAFFERLLTYDWNTNCRFNRNNPLLLSLIASLTPAQLAGFEDYLGRKTALAEGILDLVRPKDPALFTRLLVRVFSESPNRLANVRFPNTLFDLSPIAPAFTPQAITSRNSLPAVFFVADGALSGPNPDPKLARRALVTLLDPLFRRFLSDEEKKLTEEDALTALLVLALLERPEAGNMADEASVLGKMVADFFSGASGPGQGKLAEAVAQKTRLLAGLEQSLAVLGQTATLATVIGLFAVVLVLYLAGGLVLSVLYACNRLLPGRNLSLVNGVLHGAEAFSAFAMASLALFPTGLALKLASQFLRGLIAPETTTPDLAACLAAPGRARHPGGPGRWGRLGRGGPAAARLTGRAPDTPTPREDWSCACFPAASRSRPAWSPHLARRPWPGPPRTPATRPDIPPTPRAPRPPNRPRPTPREPSRPARGKPRHRPSPSTPTTALPLPGNPPTRPPGRRRPRPPRPSVRKTRSASPRRCPARPAASTGPRPWRPCSKAPCAGTWPAPGTSATPCPKRLFPRPRTAPAPPPSAASATTSSTGRTTRPRPSRPMPPPMPGIRRVRRSPAATAMPCFATAGSKRPATRKSPAWRSAPATPRPGSCSGRCSAISTRRPTPTRAS